MHFTFPQVLVLEYTLLSSVLTSFFTELVTVPLAEISLPGSAFTVTEACWFLVSFKVPRPFPLQKV